MFSIISGILGFATSGLPSLLGFFQQKGDQKHYFLFDTIIPQALQTLPVQRIPKWPWNCIILLCALLLVTLASVTRQ